MEEDLGTDLGKTVEYQSYLVTWSIDIGAASAKEAAEIARGIQLDDEPLALVFVVESDDGVIVNVDLWNGDVF